jgi:predicted flap endonuclease-1-like 5' DNA nuclease/predicted  nucleic acid-binding Zn-ribbon protein
MGGITSDIAVYLLASATIGALVAWLIQSALGRHRYLKVEDKWGTKFDEAARQRDRSIAEIATLRSTIESQQGQIHKHEMSVARGRTDLESAREKEKRTSKDIFTLRAEREDFKEKVAKFQNALTALKQQSSELQHEFIKSREFYKGELTKAFEKRKALVEKVEDAREEQESFTTLLSASRSEHESVNKMLQSAQNRLARFDALENDVIRLEAENAQLNHDSALSKQKMEALHSDVAELDELRVQNTELASRLGSIEKSRKQHEEDARRYRDHAGQSEKKSETLRIKLDEVEQNFIEMEKQQNQAIKDARKIAVAQKPSGKRKKKNEKDDLQEIVGIGKVFEHTLHELGIYSFRQIASFDMSDIARVNTSLKEFKGRMEQDDWIGQAKELYFNKYGETH